MNDTISRDSTLPIEVIIARDVIYEHYGIDVRLDSSNKSHEEPIQILIYILKEVLKQKNRFISDVLGITTDRSINSRFAKMEKILKDEKVNRSNETNNLVMSLVIETGKRISKYNNNVITPKTQVMEVTTSTRPSETTNEDIISQIIDAVHSVCCSAETLRSFAAVENVETARKLAIYVSWKDYGFDMEKLMDEFGADKDYVLAAIGSVEYYQNNGLAVEFSSNLSKIRSRLKH